MVIITKTVQLHGKECVTKQPLCRNYQALEASGGVCVGFEVMILPRSANMSVKIASCLVLLCC